MQTNILIPKLESSKKKKSNVYQIADKAGFQPQ